MSENAEKKENRKLCPFGWTHCAKEVCEWWLEFANSCAIPLTACILADSTICQAVWIKRNDALRTMECSNCGADAHYQIVDGVWRYEPYCAHCGARVYKQEDLPMSEEKKPRLAEILGVEVGQAFEIDGIDGVFYVDEFGFIQEPCKGRFCPGLSHAINCPDLIKRGPRWTEQEVKDAKNIIRLFGTENFTYAMKDENGYPGLSDTDDFFTMGTIGLENNIFPSLKPGEFVKLTDIIGGSE